MDLRAKMTYNHVVIFFSLHIDSLYVVSEIVNSANDLRSTLRASRIEDHASMISSLSGTQLANFATGENC